MFVKFSGFLSGIPMFSRKAIQARARTRQRATRTAIARTVVAAGGAFAAAITGVTLVSTVAPSTSAAKSTALFTAPHNVGVSVSEYLVAGTRTGTVDNIRDMRRRIVIVIDLVIGTKYLVYYK